MEASFLTGAFLEALVDFLAIAAAGFTVFAFVVIVRDLGLGAARVIALLAGFLAAALAVVVFALVVTAFGTGFLEGGLVF